MIAQLKDGPRGRNLLVQKQDKDSLQDAQAELEHLKHGQVLLERVGEAKGCPEVVEVHERMDKAVNPCPEKRSAISNAEMEKEAPNEPNGRVVVNMKERELVVLLAEHHEIRVEHVEKLGHVVYEDPELDRLAVLAVDVKEIVLKERGQSDGHHRRHGDLEEVVSHHWPFERVGILLALHELPQQEDDEKVADMAANERRPRDEPVKAFMEAQGFPPIAGRGRNEDFRRE